MQTVITQEDLLHKLPSSRGLHILLVQPEKVASAPAPAQPLALPPATISPDLLGAAGSESPDWQLGQLGEPDTPCYIIYTSGSTGKPKVRGLVEAKPIACIQECHDDLIRCRKSDLFVWRLLCRVLLCCTRA
jgi:non-ribosomal peptide synthetase component F